MTHSVDVCDGGVVWIEGWDIDAVLAYIQYVSSTFLPQRGCTDKLFPENPRGKS